jgi:general secretion pathway protein D
LSKSLLGDLTVAGSTRRGIDPVTNTVVTAADIFSLRRAVGQGGNSALNSALLGVEPGLTLGSMGFAATSALFELFRTKTSGRVIQAPQLIALDNEEATIQVGELVRYAESFVAQTEGGGSVSGFREASGSPIKLGLQLLIIPHVTGPENNVLMTIIPKTENFSLNRGGGGAPPGFQRFIGPDGINLDLPQTNQRIVVTKMMLRNGETGVIGGLRDEREDLSETKVPVFGEIPFIGRLFKHKTRAVAGNNLLIFVTPTIIDFNETEGLKKELDRVRTEYSGPLTDFAAEETTSAKN